MRRKILAASLLALACASAQAAETTWNFTYQGFLWMKDWVEEPEWLPDWKLEGSFTGEDRNHDGIITRDELSRFVNSGVTLLGDPSGKCTSDGYPVGFCSIERFSYALTGQLDYYVRYSDNEWMWAGSTETGEYFGDPRYAMDNLFTDETTFTITPAPVPEPSAALLLLSGLTVVGAAYRGRAKKAAAVA